MTEMNIQISGLRRFCLGFFAEADVDHDGSLEQIANDQDLIETGVVDSHTFIDLCLAIEAEYGRTIDLAIIDASSLSSINGIYNYIANADGQ
ncbi:phosphopantetheine-binding protein [Fodinicurvata sp. EGI_FJ10296]|uniref:phosphopantetheine-binding protein n=1 Tax=Fodinicurvata sp. EGI_FJ10296 TaxID=3231908 RepID=UPI003454D4FE